MRPEPHSAAHRWQRLADEDLLAAQRLVDLERHYAACFLAEQAAEKAFDACRRLVAA